MRNTFDWKKPTLTLLIGAALLPPVEAMAGDIIINNDAIIKTSGGDSGLVVPDGDDNILINNGSISTGGNNGHGMTAKGDRNTFDNNGSISTAGNKGNGMQVVGHDNVLNNNASISTEKVNSDGIRAKGNNNILTNNGVISTIEETSLGMVAWDGKNTLINNRSIATTGTSSQGMLASGKGGNTLTNNGSISTSGETARGMSAGGGDNTLTNAGKIYTIGQGADGMNAEGGGNVLINEKTLITIGDGADGMTTISGAGNALTNNGSISTSGIDANGMFVRGNGNVLINGGLISTTGKNAASIYVQNGSGMANTIDNAVGGTIGSQLGLAIRGGDGDETVANAGALISGVGTAVDLWSGNDSLTMHRTASQSGSLDGGLGTDTLIFDGYAHTGGNDLLQWEQLALENGGSLTLVSDLTMGDDGSGDGRADIDATSRLISAGDRTLGGSLQNGGIVTMQNGQAGDHLSVIGNYEGNDGTVILDTVLGDNTSPSDLLHIGRDATGDSSLKVNNVDGTGAQTTGDGIKVIEINGGSRGRFSLAGDYVIAGQQAVIGGAYGYTLWKNGVTDPQDGDWYLRSELLNPEGPDSSVLYQPGVPLYEVYPQALLALNSLPTLRQRIGNRYWAERGCLDPRLGGYVGLKFCAPPNVIWGRVEYSHTQSGNSDQGIGFVPINFNSSAEAQTSTTGASYSTDLWKMQAGMDGLFYESDAGRLIGGITINYGTVKSDINSFYGIGQINAAGYGLGATLTWDGNDGLYLDAQGQLNWFDSDIYSETLGRNMVDGNNGFGYAAGLEIGKRFELDEHWTVTPQAQLTYSTVKFDDFTDPFGVTVSSIDGESLKGRLGVSLNYQNAWKGDDGRIVRSDIYGIANLYNEFLDGTQVDVSNVRFGNQNQGLSGSLGIGGSYNWDDDKYSIHGELAVSTGLDNPSENYTVGGTLGLTVKF